MPQPTFAPRRVLFSARRDGTREFGVEWPEGAKGRLRPDQHVLQFEGAGVQVIRTQHQADVLRRAMDAVTRGTSKRARVGVAVGTFGDETLYEEVGRFQAHDFAPEMARELPANAKTVHLRISKAATAGTVEIEGLASATTVDREFDRVESDAFAKSLPEFMKNPVVLFNHDFFRPIGSVLALEMRPEGLWVKCRIDDDEVRRWVSEGRVRAFSVSFIPTARRFDPNPRAKDTDPSGQKRPEPSEIRVITEAELLEVSVVSVPMNRDALFSIAKSLDAGSDLACRACGSCGVGCDCDGGSRVVAHRPFPVSAKGVPFRWDWRELLKTFGSRGLRQSSAWSDGDDPFDGSRCLFQHHHLDDGDMRLSAEGLKVAMARLLAGDHYLSAADAKGVHAHLAAHYRELGEEPPSMPDSPNPSAAFSVAFGAAGSEHLVGLTATSLKSQELARWATHRGFPAASSIHDDHDGRALLAFRGWAESAGRRRSLELADGIEAVLAAPAEAKSEVPPAPVPEPPPMTTPKNDADPAKSADDGDDAYLEVDPALIAQLEAATSDPAAPVDGDLAERLLEQCKEAVEANEPNQES